MPAGRLGRAQQTAMAATNTDTATRRTTTASGMDSPLMSMGVPGVTHCLHEEGHAEAEQDARRVGANGVGECHVCSTLARTHDAAKQRLP